jgi:hypothetical protein
MMGYCGTLEWGISELVSGELVNLRKKRARTTNIRGWAVGNGDTVLSVTCNWLTIK